MQGKYKFSSAVMGIVLVTFAIFVAVMALTVTYTTKSAYIIERSAIREEVERAAKSQLEMEANEILEYANQSRAEAVKEMRIELKRRVNQAYSLAQYIYVSNKDSMSMDEIEAEIAEALRNVRYDGGQGYLFMDRFDGEVLLYPVHPEEEGKNVLDLADEYGNFVIRDEINLAQIFGEGFVEGYWTIPGETSGKGSLKVSYVKRFEGLDWYIGTGIYEEVYLKEKETSILESMHMLQNTKYVYTIADTNGQMRLVNDQLINGKELVDEQILSVGSQNPLGGYTETSGYDVTGNALNLSYVKPIESWDWMLVLNAHISESYTDRKAYYLKRTETSLNRIILVTGFILFFGITFLIRKLSRKIDRCFEQVGRVIDGDQDRLSKSSYLFKEFQMIAEHIDELKRKAGLHPRVVEKPVLPVPKEVKTLVEGEAVTTQALHDLNHIIEHSSAPGEEKLKLNAVGTHITEVRKLLNKLSQNDDDLNLNEETLAFEDLHLKVFTQDVMQLILSEYSYKPVDFRVFCDSDLVVTTDALVLTQIFTHLTTNAIEHGFVSGSQGMITIEVIYDDDYLRIYYNDNGQGMDPDIQERIFEPYFSTTAMKGSAGMGLTEAFSLVQDKLGGALNCSSRPGYGTDFFIDIPGIGPGLWIIAPYNASHLRKIEREEEAEIS